MSYPASLSPWATLIEQTAARNRLDPALLASLVYHESGGNPRIVSSAGAIGLAQLMPATAAELGVDPWDPAQNLDGGARYLRRQLDAFGGDPALALAAYNSGPGTVQRYGGMPPYPETQRYVQRVLATAAEIGLAAPVDGPVEGDAFIGPAPAPAPTPAPGGLSVTATTALLVLVIAVAAALLLSQSNDS